MANEVKLTKELIEELINEELNNLSEEELHEQGWLSQWKGGFKGVKKAATDAWKAGAAAQSKQDFYMKYYKLIDKIAESLNDASENFEDEATKFKLDTEESGTLSTLASRITKLAEEAMDVHGKMKASGIELEYITPDEEPVEEPDEKGGEGTESGETGEGEEEKKPGLWDKTKSAAAGFLGIDEEQEVANDG